MDRKHAYSVHDIRAQFAQSALSVSKTAVSVLNTALPCASKSAAIWYTSVRRYLLRLAC